MRRYTTATLTLTVEGIDLTACDVWVTIRQHTRKLDIKLEAGEIEKDGDDTVLTVPLTQVQTSKFRKGKVRVQVNFINDGKRGATEIVEVDIEENLLERVVESD